MPGFAPLRTGGGRHRLRRAVRRRRRAVVTGLAVTAAALAAATPRGELRTEAAAGCPAAAEPERGQP
ncbi:hypothetical protein [Streptomyces sp. MST-110588]|uniref:hypothetical protein n=1 Tax=Streptomyces sp. MST-110588 TaxID=2833628 RepID=UPI002046FE8E|nr:hypothetical protein KGS77_20560 [Streptomyces sp. MST-110588]